MQRFHHCYSDWEFCLVAFLTEAALTQTQPKTRFAITAERLLRNNPPGSWQRAFLRREECFPHPTAAAFSWKASLCPRFREGNWPGCGGSSMPMWAHHPHRAPCSQAAPTELLLQAKMDNSKGKLFPRITQLAQSKLTNDHLYPTCRVSYLWH